MDQVKPPFGSVSFIPRDDENFERSRAALNEGLCPKCDQPLSQCAHTEFHTQSGHVTIGDCDTCAACWTKPGPGPRVELRDLGDKHITAALSEGLCPDCNSPLTECSPLHIAVHKAQGDEKVWGHCPTCKACWTEGSPE